VIASDFRFLQEHAVKLRLVLALALVVSPQVSAHHRFAEIYDENREVTIDGEVVQWEFRNPHSFVHVVLAGDRGSVERWIIEWRGASQLHQRWGLTVATFRPGQRVIVTGSPGRVAADRRLRLRTVVRPQDGWTWRDVVE
jgi:hypothetical protein